MEPNRSKNASQKHFEKTFKKDVQKGCQKGPEREPKNDQKTKKKRKLRKHVFSNFPKSLFSFFSGRNLVTKVTPETEETLKSEKHRIRAPLHGFGMVFEPKHRQKVTPKQANI